MKIKWERLVLVAFLGNYLIINLVSAIVALFPASTSGATITPQYIAFVVLAAIAVALLTRWYFCKEESKSNALKQGVIFGLGGFVIAILTTLISGVSSVMAQTGSISKVFEVLPNFGPYLANWSIKQPNFHRL